MSSINTDSKTETRFSGSGYVDSSSVRVAYSNSILCLESEEIRAENIIVVIERSETGAPDWNVAHTIFSLAPAPASPQLPFELRTTDTSALPTSFLSEFSSRKLPNYLLVQPDTGNVLHVLISTLSGTGLAPGFWSQILHPLLQQIGWKDGMYNVVWTSRASSVTEFARRVVRVSAETGSKQTVLMLSGDGGMVDIINALLEDTKDLKNYTKPVLVQIPLGTGNALFHSLHKRSSIPSLYVQGLRTLMCGHPKALPIFKASFSPGARLLTSEGQTATPLKHSALFGAAVASYGLHATLVADSDTAEYRKHGESRFGLVANDLLFPSKGLPHAYQAEVILDGKAISRTKHGYVLATLVSNLEKTFTISPDSTPLDGKMRVISFGPLGGNEAMEIMKAAYDDGKHVQMNEVGYEIVNKLRIQFIEAGESWRWRRCCVDGLIIGVEEGGWMEVEMVRDGEEAVMIVVDGD